MISIGIVTELLRVASDHIEETRPCVTNIVERANVIERIEYLLIICKFYIQRETARLKPRQSQSLQVALGS